jgi:hypothetical protein
VQSCWRRRGRRDRLTDAWLPLAPFPKGGGHLFVNLASGGGKVPRPVHRLVLEAFAGPRPPGMICCHWDGDPGNNRLGNLRWDTPKANSADALRHGRRACGAKVGAKLTEQDVLDIRRLRADGLTLTDLGARFGVSPGNVGAVVHGKTWKRLLPPEAS